MNRQRLDQLRHLAATGRMPYRPSDGGPYRPDTVPAAPWYRIVNAAAGPARIDLYDFIGGWMGVSASDFLAELRAVDAKHIDLHINSPGGDVFDAVAIHAGLVNHPATVTAHVDGVAASAASFVMLAGDTISMEKPARVMIHDALGITVGNEAEHLAAAELLGSISDTIAQMYADRAGGDAKTWRAAMRAETWYNSAQALDAGLVDEIANDTAPPPGEAPQDRRSQLIHARASAMRKARQ